MVCVIMALGGGGGGGVLMLIVSSIVSKVYLMVSQDAKERGWGAVVRNNE